MRLGKDNYKCSRRRCAVLNAIVGVLHQRFPVTASLFLAKMQTTVGEYSNTAVVGDQYQQ